MIPNVLIQSHESKFTLNGTFTNCRQSILEHSQSFRHLFFSASERRNFLRERRPELLPLYDFYPRPVQRADFFRVVAIFELGGVYLDLDIFLRKPIHELLNRSIVLTEEWRMGPAEFQRRHFCDPKCEEDLIQIGNYAFAAESGHWFFDAVLSEMVHRAQAIDSGKCNSNCVFYSTGPDVLSTVYRQNRNRIQEENGLVLQGDEEQRWCQFGEFGSHLMAGSWVRQKRLQSLV